MTTPPYRVLIVDDDHIVMSGLQALFECFPPDPPLDVAWTTDPVQAVQWLRAGPPFATVVTDYGMDEMSGRDVLEEVRRLAPGVTRVILISGGDVDPSGFDAFLPIPFEYDDLLRIIYEQIGTATGQPSLQWTTSSLL